MNARTRQTIGGVVLFLGSFAAFWPSLSNGFVNWDDPGNIVLNPWLGRFDLSSIKWMWTTTQYGHFQPLAWMSLSLDAHLWGENASGFHLTALLLHALSAIVLFAVLKELLPGKDEKSSDAAAFLAALLWAVHPMRAEAVAWATERRELLAVLFELAALLAYLRAVDEDEKKPKLLPALVLFWLAALSKVTAAFFPPILVFLDLWLLGRGVRLKEKAGFFAVALATLALGVYAQQVSGTTVSFAVFGLVERLAQAAYGPGRYLADTVWPLSLSPFVYVDRAVDPQRFWPCALATVGLVLLSSLLAWRVPKARAAFFSFFSLLLPSLGFFKSGPQTSADRFFHAPSLVLAAVLAWALNAAPKKTRSFAYAACAVVAVLFAALAHQHTAVWSDSVHLWGAAAMDGKPTPLVYQNLASALRESGREAEALEVYARLSAEDPGSPAALAYSADARYAAGDYAFAAALYGRALTLDPSQSTLRVNLGLALYKLGRLSDAEHAFGDAARQDPLNASAWHNLGICLAKRGDSKKAKAAFEKALKLDPRRTDTRGALLRLNAR